jgi:hypothetical protein
MLYVIACTLDVSIAWGASSAHADHDERAPSEEPALRPGDKDPDHARALSLDASLGAWGAMAAGAAVLGGLPDAGEATQSVGMLLLASGAVASVVTPSIGHWYAHDVWSRGLTMRTAAIATGAASAFVYAILAGECDDDPDCSGPPSAVVGMALSAALYIAGTVDDIRTADDAAIRHNAHERRWQVSPTVLRAPGGPVAGLAVVGRF